MRSTSIPTRWRRTDFYDNSIDDTEARLLFRMTDGKLFKCYTDDIPLWAQTIID